MKTKKLTVNSLWIDPIIGELQILCLNSFLEKGIEFCLYTYNQIQNVPPGIKIKNANDIIDYSEVFRDNKNSYATFSDWFRIKLLHITGGWWVDCDVFCIKPFNFKVPYAFATERYFADEEKRVRICNAVIKMPANSVFGEQVLSAIQRKLAIVDCQDIVWTEIGAKILNDIIQEHDLYDYVLLPEVFCPNDYSNFKELSDSTHFSFDSRTYAVHLWNKMWEWNEMNPLEQASENSFLSKAKANLL